MVERQQHEVQSLIYTDPPIPHISKIRRSSRIISDQVWVRRTDYESFEWNIDPEEGELWYENAPQQQWQYFNEEIERLHNGDWILINGVPTYFNADCYFFHQWFVLLIENTYPQYKDTSLEYYRFSELCEDDPLTLGDCGIKGRRLGLSSMKASRKVRIGIIEDNTLSGIVSKTGNDAYEMYLMAKNGLAKLPGFITPELAKVTESEIHIAKQTSRISKNNKHLSADKGKNNRINWLDTAENAYDGRRMRDIVIDEAAKFERVNVQVLLSKISDTLLVGGSVGGYVSVFSTVNKGDKGGDNFKVIWDGSDHTKSTNGMTPTRLKRFFIEGYRGFYGYIGKYGESIVDTPTPEQKKYLETYIDPSTGKKACPNPNIGAKEWLQILRDLNKHDADLLAEQVRKYPFKWEEVFHDTNNKCHFRNPQEINNQIERIRTRIEMGGLYRRGWFSKSDPSNENEMPKFRDAPDGMWYILDMPKPEDCNKQIWKNGQRAPNNCDYGGAGVDTFSNSESTAEKGSDAAMCIFKRYNAIDPENSGMPTALFIGRPDTKLQFHQQIFWGACYYGIKMLIERSPTDWYDYAEKNKLLGYCIKTTLKINGKDVYGIAPQDAEGREQHLTEMVEWVDNNIEKLWFFRIADDLIPFNVKDRTKFDGAMSFGYALMSCKERYRPLVQEAPTEMMVRMYNLHEKYGRKR